MISNPAGISHSYIRLWDSALAARRPWPIIKAILTPLASLRLTVTLFAMTLFLVWVGTVAQQDKGMWQVMQDYFHAVVSWIEFRDVFPRAFFQSNPKLYDAVAPAGGFFFPGGITLGVALFVNLISAHIVRFKAIAKGQRLTIGLVAMALAIGLCAIVILGGQSTRGLQGKPPVEWTTLWQIMKASVFLSWIGASAALFYLVAKQNWHVSIVVALGVIACVMWGAGAIALLLSGSMIEVSSMRILWQLTQATVCGLGLYSASYIIFGRRAGIVTIHLGIGLLMFGELLVSVAAVEEQMTIQEGRTMPYAVDIRSVELAVVDHRPRKADKVIAIPLTMKKTPTRFLRSKQIRDDRLPFEIEVVEFFPNAQIKEAQPNLKNPATEGLGLQYIASHAKTARGASSSDAVDMAAAYVTVKKRGSDEPIGTYLLAQLAAEQNLPEKVSVDGETFDLYLRFRRTYKDYTVQLIDVRKDDYIGTNTPRNYSSDVRIVSSKLKFDSEQHISMNNPLRFAGETLYQSGYYRDPTSGQESTTLQIVTNVGWMIPYVACGIVMVGMLAHFVNVLLRFFMRLIGSTGGRGQATVEPIGWRWFGVGALIGIVLTGPSLRPPRATSASGIDLVRFGALPAAYEGRIKPLDAIARNTLRFSSGREKIKLESREKVSAVRWLAELLAGKPEAEQYPIFKIDNREVLHTLGLVPRKGNRFSYREISPRMGAFRDQVKLAQQAAASNSENQDAYQRKILELNTKIQRYFAIRRAFQVVDEDLTGLDAFSVAERITRVADDVKMLKSATVPYAVPAFQAGSPKSDERLWEPLIAASARVWINGVIRESGEPSEEAYAAKLVDGIREDSGRVGQIVHARMLGMIVEMQEQRTGEKVSNDDAEEALAKMPEKMRRQLETSLKTRVLGELDQLKGTLLAAIGILQGERPDPIADRVAQGYIDAFAAFRADDAKAFESAVDKLHEAVIESDAKDLHSGVVWFENYFNYVSPFMVAILVYLMALVFAIAGMFPRAAPARWIAFGLILVACLYHGSALAARIYISGRPPVTNLYSSAIFIAFGGVLMGLIYEIIFRIGIGNFLAAVSAQIGLLVALILSTTVPSHAGDTMKVMQAVLDTQFWLSTHVVTVALGYVATLIAGLLGVVAVVFALINWLSGSADPVVVERKAALGATPAGWTPGRVFKTMIYATICIGIFFSFVGTVLGGLWADDSWGRFWGWDPKENGALMIVLWNALVLHARWAGLVRNRGLTLLSIAGNLFLGWSWFGVNELGFGLHSYGFTEGVLFWLGVSWVANLAIIGFGLLIPSRAYQ